MSLGRVNEYWGIMRPPSADSVIMPTEIECQFLPLIDSFYG